MAMNRFLMIAAAWLGLTSAANAALNAQWLLQDNAASTTVVANVGTNGALTSAGNTSASTQTPGPGTLLLRALQFDGTNDYVNCTTSNTAVLTNKAVGTLSFWFKTSNATASDRRIVLVSTNAGAGTVRASAGLNSSHQIAVYARAGDAESTQTKITTATYNDGNWHHVLAVINWAGDATTIYVDGVSVAQSGTISFTGSASGSGNSAGVTIASANTSGAYFPGQLADVRIYDSNESANVAAIMAEADDEQPPVITTLAAQSLEESERDVVTMAATGDAPITWAITGGSDAALFEIDTDTGALAMPGSADFENPEDADLDNIYEVLVEATNAADVDTLLVLVTVTDEGGGSGFAVDPLGGGPIP
jgi:hypothetical protein